MNDSPAQQAARARAARRKRMQQRQTVIFGSITAVLLGSALFAGAVWAEIVPPPFELEVKSSEPTEPPAVTQPCPPEGATAVALGEISVNVMNSTETSGLGARTAEEIAALGVNVEAIDNASDLYLGSAKVLVGPEYLDVGYTVADLIPDSQIVIDTRTEPIVDIVLGSGFSEVRSEGDLLLAPDEPIPAPDSCVPAETEAGEEDAADEEEPAEGEASDEEEE